ncbi:MAG: hypothetical protein A2900_00175 [Candidatus Chisholmbacteria bacterium RIFCSPLOWO2_01_FULL_50_28]|uniref:Phospholipase C/D domain-containing protein n=1 Tax=Candidatus Chisholmbacteria bacterium RIFCSPHIGHO2_01_FULL_52_32 TaxID=1797591 RepID=A0A1G1VQV4_9BACT|nr:MAG: hypothetical protein A2786_00410 [Candidatus Chisholmbacteria bacterium RIFCSPHIGHO2_01_FULL_52_32]OGY20744.1 MAG: hypothetical protein A2900_00175 [Candidatus Chisholmbacteria bacterium RIFCSPLOWO2_01_FULL_50_28]
MHYRRHAVANTILGVAALKIAGLPVLFSTLSPAVIASFLIDADHFLYHIFMERTLSYRKVSKLVRKDWDNRRQRFYLFHTLEFGIIFTVLVYYTPLTWVWAFGYWTHLSTDAFHNYRMKKNFSWLPIWIGTLQSWRMIQAKRHARLARLSPYA